MTDNAVLETKLVGHVNGNFFVPDYQRGYRWDVEQVEMLLNDIWENGENNYCLQPVVVKKMGEKHYELIDGQQRLTTIFLIMKYLRQVLPKVELKFSLEYQTRPGSKLFLETLDAEKADKKLDFFHIYRAYEAIQKWFNDTSADEMLTAINLYKLFGERVKFIWYEVDSSASSIDLFTRLNIGKIPLTNAELVKALFLSRDAESMTEEKQLEIATTWDQMEQDLHVPEFWAFITNEPAGKYATRIELLFDMMAKKKQHQKDKYFTFFHFAEQIKENSGIAVWKEMTDYYLTLREWYERRDIYHKVGYLVAVGYNVRELVNECKDLSKPDFITYLDGTIQEDLNLTIDKIEELNYHNHYGTIEKLMLLFNVESILQLKNSSERYPFNSHKGKQWSLEHIHAQRSDSLNKKEDQQMWLLMHRNSLLNISKSADQKIAVQALIEEINVHYENITKVKFDRIAAKVFALLSEGDDRAYIDSIYNMALLGLMDNTALNNSTFDVKRNKILDMDRKGEYIPICTRRVFLKYYTESQDHQLQFWGSADRETYREAMVGEKGMLKKYLKP